MAKNRGNKDEAEQKLKGVGESVVNRVVEQKGIPRSGSNLAEFLINDERIAEALKSGYLPGQAGSTRTNRIKSAGSPIVLSRKKDQLTREEKIKAYKDMRKSLIDSGSLPEVDLTKFTVYDPKKIAVVKGGSRKRRGDEEGGTTSPPPNVTKITPFVPPDKTDTYRGFEIRKCVRPNGSSDVLTASEHLNEHLKEQTESGVPKSQVLVSPEHLFWSHEPENWARMTEQQHMDFHANQIHQNVGDPDIHMTAINHWNNLIQQGYGSQGKIWQQTIKFTR
jgi:hypothetical protein